MNNYEKPLVMANEDLTEGVYAASGTVVDNNAASQGNAADYSLEIAGGWDGNKNYNVTFTNNLDEDVPSLTVYMNIVGEVTGIDGGVSGSIEGNKAVVTFNNYGNGIAAGATVGPIYMHVTGNGDFSLE